MIALLLNTIKKCYRLSGVLSIGRSTVKSDEARVRAALESALDGDALLFVGAGVSFLSRNASDEALPNGDQLTTLLHRECGMLEVKHPLDRIANHYVRKKGANSLYALLKGALTVESVDKDLIGLYTLPWRRIYTTNYDDAIRVARKGSRNPQELTLDDEPRQIPEGAPIHINGSIGRVEAYNIASGLILTDYSYASDRLSKSEWSHVFRTDIRSARAIIFIGYRLSDLDIARILIEDDYLRRKTIFVIAPDADEVERESLEAFGFVTTGGIELVAKTQRELQVSHVPRARVPALNALTELRPDLPSEPRTESTKVFEQLVYGQPPLGSILAEEEAFHGTRYLVARDCISQAIERVRLGPWRDTILTGEMACGKTFGALQLALHYMADGYKVYLSSTKHGLADDLRTISTVGGKVCIIFDGYRSYLDEIRGYVRQRPASHVLIATERLTLHELVGDALEGILEGSAVQTVVLNDLTTSEAQHFDRLINFAGLWGDLAGASPAARSRHIGHSLNSSLYRLLLEVLKSKKVQDEIRRLFEPLKGDESSFRFFVTAFIMNALGHNFWINDWQGFYEIRDLRQILSKYRDQLSHFVMTDASTVRLRSGIISSHLLKLFASDSTVMECMEDMYEYAVEERFDDDMRALSIDLMKFNTIEPLFGGDQKQDAILLYYEKIRKYGYTQNNPDYWLQYGIAATVYGRLDKAETAFKNAYEREGSRTNPNFTKIDNYFSRYEMQKAIETESPELAFKLFKAGSDRLVKQIFLNNNRHYPFKTGRAFADIAARHYGNWDADQQKSFNNMAENIKGKAEEWRRKNSTGSVDVDILINETSKLLKSLKAMG